MYAYAHVTIRRNEASIRRVGPDGTTRPEDDEQLTLASPSPDGWTSRHISAINKLIAHERTVTHLLQDPTPPATYRTEQHATPTGTASQAVRVRDRLVEIAAAMPLYMDEMTYRAWAAWVQVYAPAPSPPDTPPVFITGRAAVRVFAGGQHYQGWQQPWVTATLTATAPQLLYGHDQAYHPVAGVNAHADAAAIAHNTRTVNPVRPLIPPEAVCLPDTTEHLAPIPDGATVYLSGRAPRSIDLIGWAVDHAITFTPASEEADWVIHTPNPRINQHPPAGLPCVHLHPFQPAPIPTVTVPTGAPDGELALTPPSLDPCHAPADPPAVPDLLDEQARLDYQRAVYRNDAVSIPASHPIVTPEPRTVNPGLAVRDAVHATPALNALTVSPKRPRFEQALVPTGRAILACTCVLSIMLACLFSSSLPGLWLGPVVITTGIMLAVKFLVSPKQPHPVTPLHQLIDDAANARGVLGDVYASTLRQPLHAAHPNQRE